MSQEETARDNYQYFSYCRSNGHDQYLEGAQLALDFFAGRQWTAEERSTMRETGRPVITVNQFFRDMDSILGEMIYSTGDVRFSPTDTGNDDVSDALDKIFLATTQFNKTQYIEPRILFLAMLTGRGYYDVRMSFGAQMQGQIEITAPRSQNIVLNPEIDDPDPDKWPEVFTTRYVNYNDVALAYGDAAAEELKNTPQASWLDPYDLMTERSLSQRMTGSWSYDPTNADPKLLRCRRLIERQYREIKYKEFFVDPETGDMSEVPENWDRNRIARLLETTGVLVTKRRASTIRWRVSCDRFLLHDDDSPYQHFTPVPVFPYFVDGYTLALGGQLIDLQRMTNKLYSQNLHILNTAANSGYKVKAGSLKNMTEEELEKRGAQTGLVAVLDDVNDLERIQPGQPPTGHEKLAATLDAKFHEVSGYTQTMRGEGSGDISRAALDGKIGRGTVNLATAYNAIYHAKTMVAERVRDLAQTFYTETRMLRFTSGLNNESQSLVINQPTPEGEIANDITHGKYMATVIPAPSRATVEQQTYQQLKEMREDLGIMIPDEVMIQYSSIPQKSQVIDAIKSQGGDPQAQQRQAQLAQQMQMADLEAKAASAANSKAQADLAHARAAKALADAQQDPQGDRIALDRERLSLEHARDTKRLAHEKTKSDRDTALKLTEMEMERHRDAQQNGNTPTTAATQ